MKKVSIFAFDNVQRMSNDSIEQLSPQGDTRENEFGGLLAAASDFARGVLESIQALAGATACKGHNSSPHNSSICAVISSDSNSPEWPFDQSKEGMAA